MIHKLLGFLKSFFFVKLSLTFFHLKLYHSINFEYPPTNDSLLEGEAVGIVIFCLFFSRKKLDPFFVCLKIYMHFIDYSL